MVDRNEPRPQPIEILDIKNFGAVYGRFLIAGQNPEAALDFINTAKRDLSIPTNLDYSGTRTKDYNPITERLSREEREKAWRGYTDFEAAKTEWRRRLVTSVNAATDGLQIEAYRIASGQHGQFTEVDADSIYERLCSKGKSDTTEFVSSILGQLETPDGKVNTKKLSELQPHLEWFARQLFGTQTGKAVTKMLELEAEIINNGDQIKNKIFADSNRINDLTPEEEQMLAYLHDGLAARPATTETPRPEPAIQPTGTVPAAAEPATQPEEPESTAPPAAAPEPSPTDPAAEYIARFSRLPLRDRHRKLMEEMFKARAGLEAINPKTGKSFEGMGRDSIVEELQRQQNELLTEIERPISTPPAATQESTKTDSVEEKISRIRPGSSIQYQGEPYKVISILGNGTTFLISTPTGQIKPYTIDELKGFLNLDEHWEVLGEENHEGAPTEVTHTQPAPVIDTAALPGFARAMTPASHETTADNVMERIAAQTPNSGGLFGEWNGDFPASLPAQPTALADAAAHFDTQRPLDELIVTAPGSAPLDPKPQQGLVSGLTQGVDKIGLRWAERLRKARGLFNKK